MLSEDFVRLQSEPFDALVITQKLNDRRHLAAVEILSNVVDAFKDGGIPMPEVIMALASVVGRQESPDWTKCVFALEDAREHAAEAEESSK
jgi:hypothetical protein